jgi:hypothetical protein
MLERGDLLAVHEPFCNIVHAHETDIAGQTFDAHEPLLAWLREETRDLNVFVKDTTDPRYRDALLADRRFLAEAHHAFLIRRPDEIAASLYAMVASIKKADPNYPDLRIEEIGLEALHELYASVDDADGHQPLVIDSDDLVSRPAATMAAYCAAVGLAFIPEALTWEPGDRPEWRRSARWHTAVSETAGFERTEPRYAQTVATSEELARFAAYHQPFYEKLRAERLTPL